MSDEDRTLPEALRAHLDLEEDTEKVRELWERASAGEREDALDSLLLDALLTDSLSERTLEGRRAGRDGADTGAPSRARAIPWEVWATAAAVVLAVGLAAYLSWGRLGYPGPEAAGDYSLASYTGEPVTRRSLLRGDRLTAGPAGAQVTIGGYCDLSLGTGAVAVIEGAPGDEALWLEKGKLVSSITPDRGAFTVQTPLGSLEVLGTEFETLVTLPEVKGEGAMSGSRRSAIVTVMVVSGLVGFEFGDEAGVLSTGMSQAFGAEAEAGTIAHGKPSYRSKGGNVHWKEKGRIVGKIQNCPGCEIDVLSADGKIVKSTRVKTGGNVYEVEWLAPGTYTMRVAARGYKALVVDGLKVKTNNDLWMNLLFEGKAAAAGEGRTIEHGKPRYMSKGGNKHWKEKGRIVGVVQSGPNFAVRVLNAAGRVVATQEAEALKDGKRAYEIWLKPGTYTLQVAAKGYDKLTIDGLVVKTDNDLRIDLEF